MKRFWNNVRFSVEEVKQKVFKQPEIGMRVRLSSVVPTGNIFDVKHGTLQRKARYVADGHKLEDPECSTYASVVSRESVRLAFLIAGLNGLEVMAADAEGAYLNAKSREKLYTICGPEFGEYEGRYAIIVSVQPVYITIDL